MPIKDDAAALELAHATCNLLNEGGTTNAALKMINNAEKTWSDKQVLNFGGLAVYAYCKEHLPEYSSRAMTAAVGRHRRGNNSRLPGCVV